LYTRSAHFSQLLEIPAVVRYRLADKALAEHNVKLAAELVRDLDQPPEDEDSELWTLRRARMLIYADQIGPGVTLLRDELGAREQMPADLADRYLQVLFDLQALNQHAEAAELLKRLYALVDAPALQREILFWQADSQTALGRHQEAAELYLRSATFGGGKGFDPWGETARFRAADELGKAGMVDDARSIYSALLRQATDPKRRVQIERQIQQLWLVRSKAATP
jgi:tetratricopeptide (TPR) repeat protein